MNCTNHIQVTYYDIRQRKRWRVRDSNLREIDPSESTKYVMLQFCNQINKQRA